MGLAAPTASAGTSDTGQEADPVELGWWSGGGALWAPATGVPEGGAVVGSALGRPLATAALRGPVPPGGDNVVVTLSVHQVVGEPTIIACPVTSGWEPDAGGPPRDAPTFDCSVGEVPVSFDEAGDRAQIDVTDLVDAGAVDIALLPDPEAVAPFTVAFGPVDQRSISVVVAAPVAPPARPPAPSPVATVVTAPPPTPLLLPTLPTTTGQPTDRPDVVTGGSVLPPAPRVPTAPGASGIGAALAGLGLAGTALGMARTALAGRS